MRGFILTGLAMLLAVVGVMLLFAFAGWVVSIAFNIVLYQIGLNGINTWGGMGIIAGATIIKHWIEW